MMLEDLQYDEDIDQRVQRGGVGYDDGCFGIVVVANEVVRRVEEFVFLCLSTVSILCWPDQ